MLQNRIIKESSNPYAFNVVVIRKKDDVREEIDRLCINYILLNKLTILNRFPLSNINKMLLNF